MKNTKDLTIGAMFGAIYGVILLCIRYLLPSTDSIIYYFIPLPIAIYTYWRGIKNGLILLVVLALLSFLISDPIRAILLLIPNYLLGLLFGLFKKKNNALALIITFVVLLIINFLSLYAFELVTGITYFESTISEMGFVFELFPSIENDMINKIILILIPIVLIIDSLLKTIILNILLIFILDRLKIEKIKYSFVIKYSYWFTILYLIIFILYLLFIGKLKDINVIYSIIFLSIFFIYNIFMLLIGNIALKLSLLEKEKNPIILVIISTIVFPIGIVLGLIYSIINNKKEIMIG